MLTQIIHNLGIAVVCFAALCMMGSVLTAQSIPQGAINGTVFDSNGKAIPNATINIHRDATKTNMAVKSDAAENFNYPLVESGTYTVRFTATDFVDGLENGPSLKEKSRLVFDCSLPGASGRAEPVCCGTGNVAGCAPLSKREERAGKRVVCLSC